MAHSGLNSGGNVLILLPGMKTFLQHIELTLTAAGVVVVVVVYLLCQHMNPWKAAALCAVFVAVVHGFIFNKVRSTQREARRKNIFSIRGMLDDMVQNRLEVVLFPGDGSADDWRSAAQRAVWEIQVRLNFIEAESLKAKQAIDLGEEGREVADAGKTPRSSGDDGGFAGG
jgi:hypothetical protein